MHPAPSSSPSRDRQGVVTSVASTLPRPTPLHLHPLRVAGPLSCRRLRLPFVKPEAFPAGRLPPPRCQILTFQVFAKVTERQSEPRGSSAGRLLGNKKGRTSRRPTGSPLFSASSPKMLLGAANAAARFNNCVRQPAPPPQESQMTGAGGGGPSWRLTPQSPSVSHRKDCTGTYHAKVKCQRILQKPPFFPIFLAARRTNQTRGKYCELTCISKGKDLMRLLPARLLLDSWALVGCLGHPAMRNKPMQLRLTF